jgi:hypothetical protein
MYRLTVVIWRKNWKLITMATLTGILSCTCKMVEVQITVHYPIPMKPIFRAFPGMAGIGESLL